MMEMGEEEEEVEEGVSKVRVQQATNLVASLSLLQLFTCISKSDTGQNT